MKVWMVPNYDDVPLLYKDREEALAILYAKAKALSDQINKAFEGYQEGPRCVVEDYLVQPVEVEVK